MKTRFSIALLTVVLLSGCNATLQSKNTPSPEKALPLYASSLVVSPNDSRQYETLKLSNGIEVILVSDPASEKSAAALSVGVGLLHDPMSQQGMAHYLEHMLFLGTEKYPDPKGYSDFMTQNGGAHNAYTWLDITNYMFKVNSNAYDEALDRFADFFKSPKLYPEYSEKEKHAVNAEWSMRREMDFFGQYKLARQLMGEHPANRFLIGNLETLGDKEGSNLQQETQAFYDRYYSANIMKVAMISNRPLSEMKSLAQKHFIDIKNKQIERPTVKATLDFNQAAGKKIYYRPKEDVKQLKLDFTIHNNQSQFAYKPNYFVTYLVANEMSGSPAQVLKSKGWINSLSAGAEPTLYGNYGSFTVNIDLTDEGMKHRDEIIAMVMQYIELVKAKGLDKKYFKEIKTALNNQFQFLEKGDEFNYVSALTQSMQDYPLNHVINANYHYAEFNEKAIQALLDDLNPTRLRIWMISQQEKTDSKLHFYDGEYRIETLTKEDFNTWKKPSDVQLTLPDVNTLLPESFTIKAKLANQTANPKEIVTRDGLRIWHLGSQAFAHQPKGYLHVAINSPMATDSAKNMLLFSVWADLYNLQQSKLINEAGLAGMPFSLSSGNGLTLNISGFTDKQLELLDKAISALPITVDEKAFAQALERQRQAIVNQRQQFPFYQAFSKLAVLTSDSSFDDEAMLSAISSVKLNEFFKLQQAFLRAHQTRVFSFGNYSRDELERVAIVLEKQLKPSEVTSFKTAQTWRPELKQTIVWQEDLDVADVAVIDLFVHPTPAMEAKAAALVLQSHLRTEVFEKLRTEEQLAYAVGASARTLDEYSAMAFYIQTPVKDVKSMQQRFETYYHDYAKVLDGLSDEAFLQLKQSTLVALNEPAKNLNDEVSPFVSDWYKENAAYDSKSKLINAVERLTLKDIQDYYLNTVLNPDAARLSIQLRGKKFANTPYADFEGQWRVKSVDELKTKATYQK
ncbi:Protease III precursor [Pseudoalteromonas luteoviolacea B = ATCC 29581]|nr:Protease III precursor [Pseudoalteromonas luteoviolacea B = ATCC 29581]